MFTSYRVVTVCHTIPTVSRRKDSKKSQNKRSTSQNPKLKKKKIKETLTGKLVEPELKYSHLHFNVEIFASPLSFKAVICTGKLSN